MSRMCRGVSEEGGQMVILTSQLLKDEVNLFQSDEVSLYGNNYLCKDPLDE